MACYTYATPGATSFASICASEARRRISPFHLLARRLRTSSCRIFRCEAFSPSTGKQSIAEQRRSAPLLAPMERSARNGGSTSCQPPIRVERDQERSLENSSPISGTFQPDRLGRTHFPDRNHCPRGSASRSRATSGSSQQRGSKTGSPVHDCLCRPQGREPRLGENRSKRSTASKYARIVQLGLGIPRDRW